MGSIFAIDQQDSSCSARTGTLDLPHGKVSTPVFMPVGTNATVKALTREDLKEIGFDIVLSNTYHLYLRPGTEVISAANGLHNFMGWDRNILTDSGGFQVFSLAPFRKITEEGVKFRSHIDGSYHFLSPEKVVEVQALFGSDIQMQLDVCTPWGVERKEAVRALETTSLWMNRAKQAWETELAKGEYKGLFFPIVQGNFFKELREESAKRVIDADCPGIAIGGLSVGESEELFLEFLNYTAALLPKEKPRYVMGIGTPEYILGAIENGIDMFDCVFPTRTGRNGHVFTHKGCFALKKAENTLNFSPIDEECGCKVCRSYSRAYLRHLFKAQEILCSMLASYHNLYFLNDLVLKARRAIGENRFLEFKKEFLGRYEQSEEKI
ncbi:tRNA guanosine(34) transglycosylase Tgt [Treponema azotonutricium]|uniref:Queuine tRNA-ribosyltransferase n=1 Tax=Leadbettera azotonutricia (strain ATCC BAA-888 / DSM 13862 / ZAS-9) TaxID=545695 RepID=F5YBN9_LEAAZ|nr:tRNA-guanine transglycosylase [Leadbettera azotonutricia ZAS-9]